MSGKRAPRKAARARLGSARRGRLARAQAAEQARQLGFERRKGRVGHRAPRMNHDVPSRWNLRLIAPQDLPDAAANAVAHYRAAHGLLDADAEAAARAWPGAAGSGVGAARAKLSRQGARCYLSPQAACRELLPRATCRERLLRAKEKGELRARTAVSRAINGFEVGSPQQPRGAREILPRAIRSA